MVDPFVEGVRSIVQVCHLVILAPVGLTIVAARGRWQAVLGAIGGVVVGGWIFAVGWVTLSDLQLRLSAVAVIVAIALDMALHFQTVPGTSRNLDDLRVPGRDTWAPAALAAGVAVVVAQWWRPCVGVELGSILTEAPDHPFGQLPATIAFMLGVSIPLVLLGLAYLAWNAPERPLAVSSWIGGSLAVVLAASVIAGQHGEIVARLFEWSQ